MQSHFKESSDTPTVVWTRSGLYLHCSDCESLAFWDFSLFISIGSFTKRGYDSSFAALASASGSGPQDSVRAKQRPSAGDPRLCLDELHGPFRMAVSSVTCLHRAVPMVFGSNA